MEQPCLGVEACAVGFVRHLDVGANLAHHIEGSSFCRTRIRRCQDAQRASGLTVSAQRLDQRSDAAAPNERHDHIDAISGMNLRENLATNARFSWCIGE